MNKKLRNLNSDSTLLRVLSRFILKIEKHQKLRIFIHGLGFSCLGAALILQTVVFSGILQNGYFRGVEQNPAILSIEIGIAIFGVAYFAYLFLRFVLSN